MKRSEYQTNGYAIFRQSLPIGSLEARERELISNVDRPLPRHDSTYRHRAAFKGLSAPASTRHGLMNVHMWRNPEVEPFIEAFRDVLFSKAIFDALHSLDGEHRYTLHQSIFFFESPLTTPHIEAMTLDTTPRGRSYTVWAAVDPVTPLNGPAFVVPRPLAEYEPDPSEITKEAHRRMTCDGIQSRGELPVTMTLNPGDFAVWGPSTPHGSMAPLPERQERRSFQAIYRPTRIDRWGGWPHQDSLHSITDEEIVVDERFNALRVAIPG